MIWRLWRLTQTREAPRAVGLALHLLARPDATRAHFDRIEAAVARDAQDPRREFGLAPERSQGIVDRQKNILGQIVGRTVPGQTAAWQPLSFSFDATAKTTSTLAAQINGLLGRAMLAQMRLSAA